MGTRGFTRVPSFSLNEDVTEKRIINTKTGVPRSSGKYRFSGA
jgi:hypothetical protein